MSNLEIWNRFADIDPKFTKPITGKSYKGTSPNPQYVIQCLTELFGPVGKGFGWEVIDEGFQPLGEEVLHWCRIRFWHGDRDSFFESYGQTKALLKTRDGRSILDEDAPKKSLTDAIVKSASHLGIAANIFLGRWDDQKYVSTVNDGYRERESGEKRPSKNEETRALYSALQESLRENKTRSGLKAWWKDPECAAKREKLPRDWQKNLYEEFVDHGSSLPEEQKEAA